jgi:hypothetical protein
MRIKGKKIHCNLRSESGEGGKSKMEEKGRREE